MLRKDCENGERSWVARIPRPVKKFLSPVRRFLIKALRRLGPNHAIEFKRLGTDYGGAWVALDLLAPNSVVYSVGVGEDISFDQKLSGTLDCTIVGFDPTPRAARFVEMNSRLPLRYSFMPFGIACQSGRRRFYFPANTENVSMSLVEDSGTGHIDCDFLTLEEAMERLHHSFVDFVKLDIEGEEYGLLESWIARGHAPPMGQLWVEFHPARADRNGDSVLLLARRMLQLGFISIHDSRNGVLFINCERHPISLLLPSVGKRSLWMSKP